MTSVIAASIHSRSRRRTTIHRFQFGPLGTANAQQDRTCVECKPRSRPVRSKSAVHAGAGTWCRTAASNVARRQLSQGRPGSVRVSRSSGDDQDSGAIGVGIVSARLSRQPPHRRRTMGCRHADAVIHSPHPAVGERPARPCRYQVALRRPSDDGDVQGFAYLDAGAGLPRHCERGSGTCRLVIVADGLIKQERTTTAQLITAAMSWQGRGRSSAEQRALPAPGSIRYKRLVSASLSSSLACRSPRSTSSCALKMVSGVGATTWRTWNGRRCSSTTAVNMPRTQSSGEATFIAEKSWIGWAGGSSSLHRMDSSASRVERSTGSESRCWPQERPSCRSDSGLSGNVTSPLGSRQRRLPS